MKQVDPSTLTDKQIQALKDAKPGDVVDCGEFNVRVEAWYGGCGKCVFSGKCRPLPFAVCNNKYFSYVEKPKFMPFANRNITFKFIEPEPTYYQKAIAEMEKAMRLGDKKYGDTFEESLDHRNITHELECGRGHGFMHLDGVESDTEDEGITHLAFNALRAIAALALQIKEHEEAGG